MRQLEFYIALGLILLVGGTGWSTTVDVWDGQGEVEVTEADQPGVPDDYVMVVMSDLAAQGDDGLPGDLDGDGMVGQDDLNIVLGEWAESAPLTDPRADPSGDNFVGQDDLDIVLTNWGKQAPVHMPEPLTMLAVGIGVAGLARYVRRRA